MKPKHAAGERRRYPRIAKCMDLALKTPDGSDVVARSINLSRNGAYCAVSTPIPMMTALNVRIELPGADRSKTIKCVECGGVVVRSEKRPEAGAKQGYHIAIFFNDITQAAIAKFARFIEGPSGETGETSLDFPLEE